MKLTSLNTGPSQAGYHRLETYQTCPQSFAYDDLLGIQPIRMAEPLALGILIHIGLAWHAVRKMGIDGLDPIEAMREAPPRAAYMFERAREAVLAYMEQWSGFDPLIPIDVERELRVKIGGRLYTQRVDLVASSGGAIFLVDRKSCAAPVETLPVYYRTSGQLIGYAMLGPKLVPEYYNKRPFGGVIVDLVGTTPPYRSKRHHIDIPPGLQAPFLESAKETLMQIEQDVAGRNPWNFRRHYGACAGRRFSLCPYIPLCQSGPAALESSRYIVAKDEITALTDGSGS